MVAEWPHEDWRSHRVSLLVHTGVEFERTQLIAQPLAERQRGSPNHSYVMAMVSITVFMAALTTSISGSRTIT